MKRTWTMREHIERNSYPDENGCWIWTGSKSSGKCGGYGIIRSGSKYTKQHQTGAHRASYESFVGPIPDGMCVCHRCDVRACVNPGHLFLGTKKDNADDMIRKGRWRTGFHKGSSSGTSKLVESSIPVIRELRERGLSQRAIAKSLGVTQGTISRVLTGKAWTHVAA